jgi:hypothetical protein
MTLREDLNVLKQTDPTSEASQQAQTLGLVYVGFGRYEDPRTQQITHIEQNGKLVPFKRAVKTNTFKTQNADDIGTYSQMMSPEIEQLHGVLTAHYSAEKYDDKQLDAIYTYTNAGYVDINNRLSTVPSDVPANKIEPTNTTDTIGDVVASLDSALKKSRAPGDFLVYTKLGQDVDISQIQPGTSFRFRGFRDTSINMQTVLSSVNTSQTGASGRPTIALLQIKVRKNSKGMYIADYSQNSEDGEFLLPRGAQINVVAGPNKLVGSDGMSQTMNLEIVYFDCLLKT